MTQYKNYSLKKYLDSLSAKTPVPGGGSAAALTACLGLSLLSMVVQYSIGKSIDVKVENKWAHILKQIEVINRRCLELVDLDAQAYLNVVKNRQGSVKEKLKAEAAARKVPREICQLCYKVIELAPFIVVNGNKYLLSDVKVALELLLAAFNSARVLSKT